MVETYLDIPVLPCFMFYRKRKYLKIIHELKFCSSESAHYHLYVKEQISRSRNSNIEVSNVDFKISETFRSRTGLMKMIR